MKIIENYCKEDLHNSLKIRTFVEKLRTMKSAYKSELADAAGVSYTTFYRWLKQQMPHLAQMGVSPRKQLLPPKAVDWICREYGIDL